MIETEKLSGKVSVRRTPLSFTVAIEPDRSVWVMIVAPLALFYTEFRLIAAAHRLLYLRAFIFLGVMLGLFYLGWFCWSVFGRQKLIFSEGEMTIASRMLGMSMRRRVAIGDVTRVRIQGVGYRVPSCVVFDVKSRKRPYGFGESLNGADTLTVLDAIAKGIPMLAGKIHRTDFE